MKIEFTKMHGLGNDFMVIDGVNQDINLSNTQIRLLSDRHFGIGFDQLLLVEKSSNKTTDFKYRIFNADGSEVSQCGNGARCFARFVYDKGLTTKKEIRVDTHAGQLILVLNDNGLVTVNMGIPRHKPSEIPLIAEQESLTYYVEMNNNKVSFGSVSMGNPHAVIKVDSVKLAPVEEIGKQLESHILFPERVNVGFMEIINRQKIKLRVYERGTAETLACGSGACAAVVVGIEQGFLDNYVEVELLGGKLHINWQGRGYPVFMTGSAERVFEGLIEL